LRQFQPAESLVCQCLQNRHRHGDSLDEEQIERVWRMVGAIPGR
jgi:hypothetical protein